jgi:phosphoribosylformylglycinamidine cyclo-ligase
MDYKSSGVDIDAGNETVRRIKAFARATFTPGVLSEIGSFGGLFRLDPALQEPVLVASADGVGTKLKVAFLANRHDTVGEDLVNHCVNDILVQGARPLFFLDYLATGRLSPAVAEQVVTGMARGCKANGCALLGGETAEMPGFYSEGEYDLAGFIVGVVERARIVDGRALAPGDVLIGLPSNGLHTNGYSLARRIVFDKLGLGVDSFVPELGETAGEALLRVHVSYLPAIAPLLEEPGLVRALAHITGGGITDNLPRVLPEGCRAAIDKSSWVVPPLFRFLRDAGEVPEDDMYRSFNMGIGLILACRPDATGGLTERLQRGGVPGAVVIGEIERGERRVVYREGPA